MLYYKRNIKHFFRIDIQLYQHSWKLEKREIVWKHDACGRRVSTQFLVFPIFTSVDITVYQYGKNVLYFFYNIAQRTLTKEWREIFHYKFVKVSCLMAKPRGFTNREYLIVD